MTSEIMCSTSSSHLMVFIKVIFKHFTLVLDVIIKWIHINSLWQITQSSNGLFEARDDNKRTNLIAKDLQMVLVQNKSAF